MQALKFLCTRIIRRRRHTLDNQRYTRTAFALCLNDVISCLYLPFITAVSFPPAAPPRRSIRAKDTQALGNSLHPYIICNWFGPTGYKLSMLHRYVSIRVILTSSLSNALPSHFEKRCCVFAVFANFSNPLHSTISSTSYLNPANSLDLLVLQLVDNY